MSACRVLLYSQAAHLSRSSSKLQLRTDCATVEPLSSHSLPLPLDLFPAPAPPARPPPAPPAPTGAKEGFFSSLVDVVVDHMGTAYPELIKAREKIRWAGGWVKWVGGWVGSACTCGPASPQVLPVGVGAGVRAQHTDLPQPYPTPLMLRPLLACLPAMPA